MSNKILQFLSGNLGNTIEQIGEVGDKWFTSKEEKLAFRNELKKIEAESDQKQREFLLEIQKAEIDLTKSIIESDNKQDDKYTKRARPSVIYAGIILAFLEMFGLRVVIVAKVADAASQNLQHLLSSSDSIMNMFFIAWGGVVGVYGYGRTKEKLNNIKPKLQSIKDKLKW